MNLVTRHINKLKIVGTSLVVLVPSIISIPWTSPALAHDVRDVIVTASSANATPDPYEYGCSAGDFTGSIRIYTHGGVYQVAYKINKGGEKGGNSANVYYADNGNLPITKLSVGDNGIQDNQWHSIGSYSGGGGPITTRFVFDKSWASDPSCVVDGVDLRR